MNQPDIIPAPNSSFIQLNECEANGMTNGGYRLVPESLRKQKDITLSQALFLSLFLFGKNQTRTNKELASLYDPSKDTSTQVPQIFIRKLVDKGYLTVHGKGKARKVMPTLKALKFATGKQLYLVVHQDIMQAPVSGSRKMFHAAQRRLEHAGATGLSKTLGLQKVTAYYHMAEVGKRTVDSVSQPNMFLDSTQYVFRPYIKIEDNKSIINNRLIIYKKPIDKSIGRGLCPAVVSVSSQIFLSGEPMYPDQYSKNQLPVNQSPAKPQPKPKPFSYSDLARPQRRAAHKRRPPDIPPTYRAEIQSLAHLPHIAQHRPDSMAMHDSCKVIFYLKTGLGSHMSPEMVDKIWDDLKWRQGADRAKLDDILAKKWTAAERLGLFQALNDSLDPAYGYKGKKDKVTLSEAFYNVDYGFSQLIKVAMLPPKVEEKKEPTPVQVPEELKEMADAILKATNEPKPTIRFIDMLNDLKKYWEEEVNSKLVKYDLCTFNFTTWWTSMVDFITWDCGDDPKWPFFKPGMSPFARWEQECQDRIRYDIQNEAWKRQMIENREREKIEAWRAYMEDEGVTFPSYEEASSAWQAAYSK